MLTLTFVDSYLAVVDHGGIREAARAKGVSQAAISQHVRKLEAELGAPLLHRSHAACTPTRHGHIFLPLARSLVSLAGRASRLFDEKHLRIGASSNIGVYFLPRLLNLYSQTHSDEPRLEVTLGSNPDLIEKFKEGQFDVALTEWWEDDARFVSEVWHREEMVVIAPPGHPLASQAYAGLAELNRYPLIAGESGTGTAHLLRTCFDEASMPAPHLVLGSTEAVKQAVMNGLGVSIVLAGAVRREAATGELVALPISREKTCKAFHISVPANLPDTTASAGFMRFVRHQGALHA
ncbi:MAG: LysR family transcriptional regulator [Rhodocyclaceae bacterium]|jgi:DNA-binding transcriptional LysR family regulator|nr:LysR family transcriptional regulator [Rhodocyclaceae bacterium]